MAHRGGVDSLVVSGRTCFASATLKLTCLCKCPVFPRTARSACSRVGTVKVVDFVCQIRVFEKIPTVARVARSTSGGTVERAAAGGQVLGADVARTGGSARRFAKALFEEEESSGFVADDQIEIAVAVVVEEGGSGVAANVDVGERPFDLLLPDGW